MKALATLTLLFISCCTSAQTVERSVIGSAGKYTALNGSSHSFTVGEAVTATYVGSTNILTQGFQQTSLLSVSVSEEELHFNATVFPNPTLSSVTLILNAGQTLNIRLDLYDLSGRYYPLPQSELMLSGSIRREIDFSGFAAGTYILQLTDLSGKMHQTIRVQKLH